MLKRLSWYLWHTYDGKLKDVLMFLLKRDLTGKTILLKGFWYDPEEYIPPLKVRVIGRDSQKSDWWNLVTLNGSNTYLGGFTGKTLRQGREIR